MTSSSERVRALAEKGTLDQKAAESLLSAIAAPAPRGRWSALLNPFERLTTTVSLAGVVCVTAIAVGVSLGLGLRFDGFLDLHRGQPSLVVALRDQAAAVLVSAVVYYALARAFARGVRFVDFLGVTGLARVPQVLCAIPMAFLIPPISAGQVPTPSAKLLVLAAVALFSIAAHITWLFQGFTNASGLVGGKRTAAFIGATLVSEIVSKLVVA